MYIYSMRMAIAILVFVAVLMILRYRNIRNY